MGARKHETAETDSSAPVVEGSAPVATPAPDAYAQERAIAHKLGVDKFWRHESGSFVYSVKALTAGRNRPDQFTEIPV